MGANPNPLGPHTERNQKDDAYTVFLLSTDPVVEGGH
jgi:hypothetical protein